METEKVKALFIVVNAGFSEEAVEIARECGARGATILNARGSAGVKYKLSGINYEPEKEMILSLVADDVAAKIMNAVHAKSGIGTPAHGICFSMPVE
ncbi:MAG: P-II family nitrogen regulator, partial [Clostridiales bacterium]|nr:P-II family nitrogen regulator [Clostridiales bacterium]